MDVVAAVQEHYRNLRPGQKGQVTKWIKQTDGVLIMRHPPPGIGLPPILPELRPDVAVITRTVWHWHGDTQPHDPPVNPTTGKQLPKKHVHTARSMRNHIREKKSEKISNPHAGENTEVVHSHEYRAKYIFPPGPNKQLEKWHDHADPPERGGYAGRPDRLETHHRLAHQMIDVAGRHSHTYKAKDTSEPLARRIDMNPLAARLFPQATHASSL
jgi:hypothetical protein